MTSVEIESKHDWSDTSTGLRSLAALGVVSVCIYAAISLLSWRFDYASIGTDRPIILVLMLFAAAFIAYLLAIRVAFQAPPNRSLVKLVVVTAVLFRAVMLFSMPIQEVDIYRYLWDGAVSTQGVSPFLFSPLQVSMAEQVGTNDEVLQRLVDLVDGNPTLAEVLQRVHFSELPTIYPITSQAVFAIATLSTPVDASLLARLSIMKAWLIGFDLATLWVVISLLRLCGKSETLCIIYAWCPLLMKEVSNSGHLDAVAVFLTTLAIYLTVRLLVAGKNSIQELDHSLLSSVWRDSLGLLSISFVLALAVAAKMYPIVLAPLLFLTIGRQFGWRKLVIPTVFFFVAIAVLFAPILVSTEPVSETGLQNDPSLGVVTFLRRWEMNDFLFLLVIENVQPSSQLGPDQIAWFTVVRESVRQSTVNFVATSLRVADDEVPFLVARALTAIIFVVIAVAIAWRASKRDVSVFCEAAFLTIAWFWLLCPTQNPWYWTWALPFLPFARGRAWLAISGLVFVYYLRFWLEYHHADTTVLGTPYSGTDFYDYVVTWIEFGPWFLVLLFGYITRQKPSYPVNLS